MSDQKNLIIAIVLSVAILFGFQFLVEAPRQERLRTAPKRSCSSKTNRPCAASPDRS